MTGTGAKALVLSCWDLNHPNSGGVRRILALLEALGPSVVLLHPGPPHPRYETLPLHRHLGRRRRGINWGIFDFFWPSNARLVREAMRSCSPAAVVLTSIWEYFPLRGNPTIPVVLDAMDVIAAAIGERLGKRHPITRIAALWEARVMRRVNHVFTCSALDRAQVLSRYGIAPDRVTTVPNGVDPWWFDTETAMSEPPTSPGLQEHLGSAKVLFFMGKLTYQPNLEALAFLSESVMPALDRRAPGRFKALVCGGPVPARPFHRSMIFTGVVPTDELRRCLRRADMCLAPIFTGSGTRLKILEYLAACKPVVSTPKGAEGLACEHDRHLMLADADCFVERIQALADNPDRAAALARAGHIHVRQHFDWTSAAWPLWRQVMGQWLPL